jgi:hypothetical protein
VDAGLLKPGGRLFIREGHPMLWALDDTRTDGVVALGYSYFETAEPLVTEEGGTYVETETEFEHNVAHSWNHGLGELVTALLDNGLQITGLEEHESIPWDGLPGAMSLGEDNEYRLSDRPERLAASYTLQARKPG